MRSNFSDVERIAKQDFRDIQRKLNQKSASLLASIQSISYTSTDENTVTATCSYQFKGDSDVIEASIKYTRDNSEIFADASTSEMTDAILSSLDSPILAADDDEFSFDDETETFEDDSDPTFDEEISDEFGEEIEEDEIEDPEVSPNIPNDNNIAGHYIVECDRCHGVFISALTESDQIIDHITGTCPLCEKESDQQVKWVIKPVEF